MNINSKSGKLFIAFSFIFVLFHTGISAQQQGNIGFEFGNFTGWTTETGMCCPAFTTNSAIDTSRQAIMFGNGTDPFSNGLIQTVAPYSNYSARLGNSNNSAEAEALEYNFTVSSDSLLLIIRYAVILENGNHPSIKQPGFKYKISSNGNMLEGCTDVTIKAGESTPDHIFGDVECYNWKQNVINLSGMSGQNIAIRFETNDCSPGGHFGYAYVDCELVNANVEVTGCANDGSIILSKPTQLEGTWFNGSTNDSITIYDPQTNGDYFLELNYSTECSTKLFANTQNMLPNADFVVTKFCDNYHQFNLLNAANIGDNFLWHFGDGSTSNNPSPMHQYQIAGNYQTSLLITNNFNCRSNAVKNIEIDNATVQISFDNNCLNFPISFEAIELTTGNIQNYAWYYEGNFIGDGQHVNYLFQQAGSQPITLVTTDILGCIDTVETNIVIDNSSSCNEITDDIYVPNAFTPNGDGLNDFFEITSNKILKNVSFSISNRFGQIVSTDIMWDGNSKGINCIEGIYIYSLKYQIDNKIFSRTGYLALIK